MLDPPAKSATIQSSWVGFIGILADGVLMGVPAFGTTRVASDSTDRALDGRVARLGRIVRIGMVPTGRGDRVKGWTVGVTRSFGRPTRWASNSDK